MADKETVKFDPVEAAKMKAPSTLFEKKKPEEKPAPPPAKVELVRPPASDAEVEAVLGKRKRYRVKDDVAVHVNGCLTNLMKGEVVSCSGGNRVASRGEDRSCRWTSQSVSASGTTLAT
jgi:hypothetical protein